jgi:hypothetical protein
VTANPDDTIRLRVAQRRDNVFAAQVEELSRRYRRRRRWLALAVALGLAVLVGGGVAFATKIGPFSGISAVDHPQRAQDVLDPAVVAQLRADEAPGGDQIGTHDMRSARLVGTLPSARNVYVVATSRERLCVVVARLAESCGDPLTQAEPVTFTVVDRDGPGGEPAVAYGVARDGVKSVSFTVGGRHETVPVRANMFAYQAPLSVTSDSFSAVTVTLADGSTLSVG